MTLPITFTDTVFLLSSSKCASDGRKKGITCIILVYTHLYISEVPYTCDYKMLMRLAGCWVKRVRLIFKTETLIGGPLEKRLLPKGYPP